ncbi:hypothetical protein [Aliikangiella coralliicola]|uniref:Uncharacterized protein n=1 Tax=Aliikangiella coralliicola TaxID=2592383 RepID=A0A545UD00_9GAMM|nr:hypothetical protein [Aliikangiella coralliicola]TQV87342.1 hypothetical protein FLL46_12900 [Aliikangiella coralliicola]
MKNIKQTLTALTLGAIAMTSVAISAADTEKRHIMVKVDKSGDHDALVDLKVDGDAEAFTMPELEVGESKTITTKSGKTIFISKTEEGLTLDVEGKQVKLPSFDGHLGARIHSSLPLHQSFKNTVQISGVKLDDNQKQIIKDAFAAAGIDKKINFSEHNLMVFSTDDMEFGKGGKHMKWFGESDAQFEFIVDDESEVIIDKKIIHIEEK